jgi:uncharacterized UBP type Zn finger protein
MAEACAHIDQTGDVEPKSQGCGACEESGDRWVHLRLCMTCGTVGCCDNSKNRHARGHFETTGHPIIQSFEPGEDWWWCYLDEAGFRVPGAPSFSYR